MFSKRRASRIKRRMTSDWVDGTRLSCLEPRFMASLVFTRTSPDGINSSITDPQPQGQPLYFSGPQPSEASSSISWTSLDNGNVGGIGYQRQVSSTISHAVIDSYTEPTIQKIDVLVGHSDQGALSTFSGPPVSDPIPFYQSQAFAELTWDISNSDATPLPSYISMTVNFDASFTASNPDNMAEANLTLRSSFLNVNVNWDGIVIADPNGTGPGISLPPGVASPGGTVIAYDPTFGHTQLGSAHENFLVNIPTNNQAALSVFMEYHSALNSPPLEDLPPGYPDRTHFQDGFDWGLTVYVA